ncbi:MAG TPA: class D sortase [Candidatus Polarisedimenticolia bacterium]|nr:class D sortase [Candidatus Polarisedimenticolia bacterium]
MTAAVAGRPPKRVAAILAAASAALLAAGAALVGRHLYLEVKAVAAGVLIDRAWAGRLDGGRTLRPWSWADFAPIARLESRRLGIDRPILSDASGRTLAFGLGHLPGSAPPAETGTCVVAGHRDTWAAFLRDLRTGDEVLIRIPRGARRYRVAGATVVDAGDLRLTAGLEPTAPTDRLLLTTCWPFGALRRGPLRYVVICEAIDGLPSIALNRRPTR